MKPIKCKNKEKLRTFDQKKKKFLKQNHKLNTPSKQNPVGFKPVTSEAKQHVKGKLWCNIHGEQVLEHTTTAQVHTTPNVNVEYDGERLMCMHWKDNFCHLSSACKVVAEYHVTEGGVNLLFLEYVCILVNATLKNCIVVFIDSMHV